MRTSLQITTVLQGEVAISSDPEVVFGTVLGSCIAVCMFDKTAGVGGMNHFLLPGGEASGQDGDTALRFGINAMERLVNGILKAGGKREALQCKAFGGGAVLASMSDVGAENVAFLQHYLRTEGLECTSFSFGGFKARRIRFWPCTGDVRQSWVTDCLQAVGKQEEAYQKQELEIEQRWRSRNPTVELF